MPDTTCHMSISLDGFVAGPDQSRENPLGKRGRELHAWHLGDERANDADATATDWLMRPRGAYVMGRNMFGPIRGERDEDWRGWWGPEPPYHAPVFVLTHHAHEPIEMEGGTTFHFVTGGFDAAYAQARETAGEDGVDIAGGASTVRQALVAGVVDELTLDVAPVLLGSGERIFDGVESFGFEPVEVLHSPLATHIRYRQYLTLALTHGIDLKGSRVPVPRTSQRCDRPGAARDRAPRLPPRRGRERPLGKTAVDLRPPLRAPVPRDGATPGPPARLTDRAQRDRSGLDVRGVAP